MSDPTDKELEIQARGQRTAMELLRKGQGHLLKTDRRETPPDKDFKPQCAVKGCGERDPKKLQFAIPSSRGGVPWLCDDHTHAIRAGLMDPPWQDEEQEITI